jgi:hypothetical protein
MKKNNNPIFLLAIIFLSSLSLGAWWEFGKPKEEPAKTQTETKSSQPNQAQTQAAPQKAKTEKDEAPNPAPIEVANVQRELSEIIDRTSKLQNDVQVNRIEVLTIMERAKIHDRILKTIKVPQPVKMPVKTVDADAIVKQEKLRLIAAQTRQAQKQLETIQRTRHIQSQRTTR